MEEIGFVRARYSEMELTAEIEVLVGLKLMLPKVPGVVGAREALQFI